MNVDRSKHSGGPWASFFVAVQFLLLLPLLPLGAELLFTGQIAMSSLMAVTSTYAISLSMSSINMAVWSFGVMSGIVFAGLFGWSLGRGDDAIGPAYLLGHGPVAGPGWLWAAAAGIGIMFIVHVGERLVRHVGREEPFPEFLKGAN